MDKQSFLERLRQTAEPGIAEEWEREAVGVVTALSHLLTDSARRRHFVSQLPGFLKAPLLAEARPVPTEWTRDGFVQHVAAGLGTHAARAEVVLRGIYAVLRDAIAPGQIAGFEAQVPADIRALLHPAVIDSARMSVTAANGVTPLGRLFDQLNPVFFHGRLPRHTVR
jgi:uncharacterized protein (DUF2267 family)